MKKHVFRSGLSFLTAAAAACSILTAGIAPMPVQARAERLLTLEMAKKSGLANSSDYEKLESELMVKEASYAQAVKSIQAKQKNMSTFRWSPLLSFHFPEKPDLSEAYEFQFKPLQIQAEIDTVKHKLTDQVIAVNETVSKLYVNIVVKEDSIEFNERRLASMEETLRKNRLRLKLGEATQEDIDAMEANIKALNSKLATDQTQLEADKKKMSKAVGMDISTGYRFENPLVKAEITRDQLEDLIQYTLDRDQNYYEVSLNATTSRLSVQTNYSLMEGQYGSDMGYISSYVNQALSGQKVSSKAFKKSYEEFLTAIDAPWNGHIRILFIKIPKEWFKGSLSGIRYVEDEPHALYEATLEYQDARLEQENEKESLIQQVEDNFNNLVNVRNSYLSLVDDVAAAREQLEKDEILNRLGELTYDEYSSSQEDYEDMENDMMEALGTYSETLYSFDRLTCGGVSELLERAGVNLATGAGGLSYIEEAYAGGASYYIEPIIQEQEFRIGVNIPNDFPVDITDYELWCDGTQIGSRTDTQKPIRHLMLSVDHVDEVKLRFYDGNTFVDECEIDPNVRSGPLNIVSGYNTVDGEESREIGTYKSSVSASTNLISITLQPNSVEGIRYYRILNQAGKPLVSDSLIPIGNEFRYPALLEESIGDLVIEFYESATSKKYNGHFDTSERKLIRD